MCCRHLEAFTSICGAFFFLLPALSYFHFFFLSQFFSHSISTLFFHVVSPLFLSLPSLSLVPHQNGEQMWLGTNASLLLNHSLIYQTGPSCSAMTGLNYRARIYSKTASPTPPHPSLLQCCVCVCTCVSDGEISQRKRYTCLSCIVLP